MVELDEIAKEIEVNVKFYENFLALTKLRYDAQSNIVEQLPIEGKGEHPEWLRYLEMSDEYFAFRNCIQKLREAKELLLLAKKEVEEK